MRWRKSIKLCKEIEFKVSDVFRKENHCANKLTLLGLKNKLDFKFYDDLPAVIKLDFYFHNRYQPSMFGFV